MSRGLLLTGWLLSWGAVVLTGCRTIGPARLALDRFDYTTAIAESNKELMLSNLVRIRYSDAPVFLDVISVIHQYDVGGSVSADATAGSGLTGDGVGFRGSARYRERPTIARVEDDDHVVEVGVSFECRRSADGGVSVKLARADRLAASKIGDDLRGARLWVLSRLDRWE